MLVLTKKQHKEDLAIRQLAAKRLVYAPETERERERNFTAAAVFAIFSVARHRACTD